MIKAPKLASKTRKAWRKASALEKTFQIICQVPGDENEMIIEKTGTYAYIRSIALSLAASGNCVIKDIKEKE